MSRISNPTITYAVGVHLLGSDFCDGHHFDLGKIISDERLSLLRRKMALLRAKDMFSLCLSNEPLSVGHDGFLALAKKMAAPSWGKKPPKTERLKIIQQCYGGVWEDVSTYAYDHPAKDIAADMKAYRESGYPTRLVTRRGKVNMAYVNVHPERATFGWHDKAAEAFVYFRANTDNEDQAIAAFFKHYGIPFSLVEGADMPLFQWNEDTNRHYFFSQYTTTAFAETLCKKRTEFVRVKK